MHWHERKRERKNTRRCFVVGSIYMWLPNWACKCIREVIYTMVDDGDGDGDGIGGAAAAVVRFASEHT